MKYAVEYFLYFIIEKNVAFHYKTKKSQKSHKIQENAIFFTNNIV